MAVPVRLHICVGIRRAASRVSKTDVSLRKGGVITPPFCFDAFEQS
jgi:hypothetical protein